MGFIIAAVIILLLLFVPVGIRASYDRKGPLVLLCIGPFRFKLYSEEKKKSQNTKNRKKQIKEDDFESTKSGQKRGNRTLDDFLEILRFIFDALSDLRRKLIIDDLRFKIILAGNDPCDVSVNYGYGWAILGNLMPHFERFFTIKKRHLEVECDYIADKTFVDACIQFHITIGRLLQFILFHGVRFLKKYYKHIKQFKGGATT